VLGEIGDVIDFTNPVRRSLMYFAEIPVAEDASLCRSTRPKVPVFVWIARMHLITDVTRKTHDSCMEISDQKDCL
jgi:hypothetical protein